MSHCEPQTHDSLYLVDGNVVLIAPHPTGMRTLFRVHQSVLAKSSPIFATMFTLPASAGNEMYDGVPLVQMQDGAEELESLLQVLYHEWCANCVLCLVALKLTEFYSTLPIKRLDPSTPSSVKQVLTLANKYGMEALRERIVMHIEGDWPQALWRWDSLEHEIREMAINCEEDANLDDYLPEPASAIRLARDCNIPSILPSAFYHLSRISVYHDRHKVRHGDFRGTCFHHDDTCDYQRSADWNLLSSSDYTCLLKGKVRLAAASCELFKLAHHTEPHTIACLLSRDITPLLEIREACRESSDVLEASRQQMQRKDFGDHVCSSCTRYIRRELGRFRRALWLKLPEYFALI
jgi:BTB/POZ domain